MLCLHIVVIDISTLSHIAKFYIDISIPTLFNARRIIIFYHMFYHICFTQFMWDKSLFLRSTYIVGLGINEREIIASSIGALNQSNAVSCHFGFPFPGQVNFRLRAIFLILDYRRRGYRSRHLRIKWKGRLAMGFDRWNEFSMEAEIEDPERKGARDHARKGGRELALVLWCQ